MNDLAWSMPLDLETLVIDTVTCGYPEFRGVVKENICVAWSLASTNLGYDLKTLWTELHLIDILLADVASQVDTTKTVGTSSLESLEDEEAIRDTEAQRRQQAKNCQWSSFASTEQWQKDAEGHARNQFTANTEGDTNYTLRDYDRTRVRDSRWTFDNALNQTRNDLKAAREATNSQLRLANSLTTTAPLRQPASMDPGDLLPPAVSFIPFNILGFTDTIQCEGAPPIPTEPCFVSPTGECIPLPSYGTGCRVTYQLSIIDIGLVAGISITWSFGETYRQVHVCTCGGMNSQRERTGYRATTSLDREKGRDVGAGLGNGTTERDIHRTNRFVRTNARRWDASGASNDQNRAEARRGSDKSQHREAVSFGNAFSTRVSTARMDSSTVASKRTTTLTQKKSQWHMALSDLRSRLWDQIERVKTNRANNLNNSLSQMRPVCTLPMTRPYAPFGIR